jgi:hypothetical protein
VNRAKREKRIAVLASWLLGVNSGATLRASEAVIMLPTQRRELGAA